MRGQPSSTNRHVHSSIASPLDCHVSNASQQQQSVRLCLVAAIVSTGRLVPGPWPCCSASTTERHCICLRSARQLWRGAASAKTSSTCLSRAALLNLQSWAHDSPALDGKAHRRYTSPSMNAQNHVHERNLPVACFCVCWRQLQALASSALMLHNQTRRSEACCKICQV